MSRVWTKKEALGASLAPRKGTYEVLPASVIELGFKQTHPHLFTFEAVSVGDENGQMFLVPLDESSEETVKFILKAIKFYAKNLENKND